MRLHAGPTEERSRPVDGHRRRQDEDRLAERERRRRRGCTRRDKSSRSLKEGGALSAAIVTPARDLRSGVRGSACARARDHESETRPARARPLRRHARPSPLVPSFQRSTLARSMARCLGARFVRGRSPRWLRRWTSARSRSSRRSAHADVVSRADRSSESPAPRTRDRSLLTVRPTLRVATFFRSASRDHHRTEETQWLTLHDAEYCARAPFKSLCWPPSRLEGSSRSHAARVTIPAEARPVARRRRQPRRRRPPAHPRVLRHPFSQARRGPPIRERISSFIRRVT